jgi:hypothetical protein
LKKQGKDFSSLLIVLVPFVIDFSSTDNALASSQEINKSIPMLRYLSLLGVLLISYAPSVLACEGCKEPSNVAGDAGVGGISASFSWSVVFMLGMLAFLLTGMLFMIVRSCKQLAERQNQVSNASRFASSSPGRANQDASSAGFGVGGYATVPAVQS